MKWQPMKNARKNGKPVLLQLKAKIPRSVYRNDLSVWDGLQFVGQHPGIEEDGFDIGWCFAAPVGCGGFPDEWFDGWQPLPDPPKESDKL